MTNWTTNKTSKMDKSIFDEKVTRRGTNSYKWDYPEEEGVIPMWVADMDFKAAPAILEALKKRVEHGVFGYTKTPNEYFESVKGWFSRRHGWEISDGSIISAPGVVTAVSAILQALTEPGDKVIMQTPAYNCFFNCISNNGLTLSDNKLLYDNGRYSIDWEDLEEKAKDPKAKLLLLCNPHNPSGRVWTRSELERIADICLKNNVFVISDEIHCELTFPGHDYTPYATISEEAKKHSLSCVSPSKAFNIAGLQNAMIVVEDRKLRDIIEHTAETNEICDFNPFGVEAVMAAYNDSEQWLDALREYLWDNYLYLSDFFAEHFPEYKVTPLEGTYLVWVECSASGMSSEALAEKILKEKKVMFNPGKMYGDDNFLRINIACPKATLVEALDRLIHI